MSAECVRCGSDLVYPADTWPVGECARCNAYDERDAALAALTVAREREQRLRAALERIGRDALEPARIARAALDEPAAADEPGETP